MRDEPVTLDAALREVEKISASPGFARSDGLARFLRYVVEQSLNGQSAQLKETVIGVEVYGRVPAYDPKLDPVVRMQAAKLRTKLTEFYAGPGNQDPVIIEMPKGSYAPVLRAAVPRVSRRPLNWRWIAAGATVLVAAAVWGWLAIRAQTPSIAVLPFVNLSALPENEYFSDGLTDEIIQSLSMVEGLSVKSRTSSFAWKGKPQDIREIGRKLDASVVLEGSVFRTEERLRVSAQLVRVSNGSTLWSNSYDRQLKDTFAIQDEISRSIVNALRVQLGGGQRRYSASFDAYDLYLKGRYQLDQRGGFEAIKSLPLFEQAIAKDPNFAPAFVGIGLAYFNAHYWRPIQARDPGMKATAERALELDPLLPDAHLLMALVQDGNFAWADAEREYRKAIQISPNFALAHQWYGHDLTRQERLGEALRECRMAVKLDPLSLTAREDLAYVYLFSGRYKEAVAESRAILAVDPNFPRARMILGRALFYWRQRESGIRELQAHNPRSPWIGAAYAFTGRRQEAQEVLNSLLTEKRLDAALVYAALGEKSRALDMMEDGLARKELAFFFVYPEFAGLRAEPRFQELRRKAGLSK